MASSGYLRNSRWVFLRGSVLLAAAVAVLLIALAGTRPLQYLENGAYDVRVAWSARRESANRSIVIIDVDDASYDALKEKLGHFPWTRRIWTELIRYVAQGQPRALAFDAAYGGRENNSDPAAAQAIDAEFAQVTGDARVVVHGYSFSETTIAVADPAPLAEKRQLLAREAAAVEGTPAGERFLPEQYLLDVPYAQLAQAAAGLGSINASLDFDGKLRAVALQFVYDGRAYRSLPVRVADLATGAANRGFHLEHSFWTGTWAVRGSQRIPVDARGRMLLLWHGDAFAYQRIPLWEVICSMYPAQCPADKQNTWRPEFFHDKIVLVGASAAASYDVHPTPFSDIAPGFIGHATAIDNLLAGSAIRPAPGVVLVLLVTAAALAGTGLVARYSALSGAALLAAGLLGYAGLNYAAFTRWHLWLPLVAPMLATVVSYGLSGALRFATVGRDLRRTRATLDRYIAPQLVSYVLDNLDQVKLGGDKRELTILVSDVRNFTTWTEKSDPQQLIVLLNEYLTAMTEVIFKHDGIVDKFIGDGILAYWGAFTPGKNHALQAARAGVEMMERLKELNAGWKARGFEPIAIGMGINTGEVIFGSLGAGKKAEFTVIGDPVNLASRLEGLNKEFKTSIIVSESTRERLGGMAQVRPLGGVKVKGKTVETIVYELQALHDEVVGEAARASD